MGPPYNERRKRGSPSNERRKRGSPSNERRKRAVGRATIAVERMRGERALG